MLPIVHQEVLTYRTSRLTNVYVSTYFGTWDLCTLRVS